VGRVVIETLEKVANGDLGTLYGGRAAAIKTLAAILSEFSSGQLRGAQSATDSNDASASKCAECGLTYPKHRLDCSKLINF